jgi:hypothetical protein
MNRVPDATLALPVEGLNLTATTLAGELAASQSPFTMLAFLRHYGCMFGREMVRDIRSATRSIDGYPTPLFFGLGNCEETEAHMADAWPEARVICDPDRTFFSAFDLGRGSVMQMFGPSVWACTLRASFKGHIFGKTVGDPWMMPGLFVIDRASTVRFQHEFRHQGDHPDWSKIPAKLTTTATDAPPLAAVLA